MKGTLSQRVAIVPIEFGLVRFQVLTCRKVLIACVSEAICGSRRLSSSCQLLALCAIRSDVGWYRGGPTGSIDPEGPIFTYAIMLRWY
jgi:hypothetical protein